jgi:hypothetical protein
MGTTRKALQALMVDSTSQLQVMAPFEAERIGVRRECRTPGLLGFNTQAMEPPLPKYPDTL